MEPEHPPIGWGVVPPCPCAACAKARVSQLPPLAIIAQWMELLYPDFMAKASNEIISDEVIRRFKIQVYAQEWITLHEGLALVEECYLATTNDTPTKAELVLPPFTPQGD